MTKTMLMTTIALTLAVPGFAQSAPAPEPKQDCCEEMKAEGKSCCCKDMADKDHDLKQGSEKGHEGHSH